MRVPSATPPRSYCPRTSHTPPLRSGVCMHTVPLPVASLSVRTGAERFSPTDSVYTCFMEQDMRTHVCFKCGDPGGVKLFEFDVESTGLLPAKGELVTLPVDYDEQRLQQYEVVDRYSCYSWQRQGQLTTQYVDIIVTDA
jgi:hypothetical protein